MAEISQNTINRVLQCYQELISIISFSTKVEYNLFAEHGETEATINDLNELSGITTDATNNLKRLNAITIRIATIQPQADTGTANILEETLTFNEAKIPAWRRSIQEVINNWR